jgi:hypothetical protein
MRGFLVSGADMAIATAPGREAEEAVVYVSGPAGRRLRP